jgi:hypothetical protein
LRLRQRGDGPVDNRSQGDVAIGFVAEFGSQHVDQNAGLKLDSARKILPGETLPVDGHSCLLMAI